MKSNLTILWLDDQRNPLTYFKKKDEKGEGTLHDNLLYYQNLSKSYNLSFVWVKNFKEFTQYIQTNGVPQFVSFDHDLSKTSLPTDPKGLDCARWLVDYCKENGCKMPMTYVHSANYKWRDVIRDILAGRQITETKKQTKNMAKINESKLRKIISESIKNAIKESGVGNPNMTQAYKQLLDCVYNIVVERGKYECPDFDERISAVDSFDTLKHDVYEYTKRYIFPMINKVYQMSFNDYDMAGASLSYGNYKNDWH